VTDEAKVCGACGATSSPQWWQAEPRLCGHETLCHSCHTEIKAALVDLVAAARRLPKPVLMSMAITTRGAADMHERKQLARAQVEAAGGVPPEVRDRHGRQCGWQLERCRDPEEHRRWFP
jgi:hypothetical protein